MAEPDFSLLHSAPPTCWLTGLTFCSCRGLAVAFSLVRLAIALSKAHLLPILQGAFCAPALFFTWKFGFLKKKLFAPKMRAKLFCKALVFVAFVRIAPSIPSMGMASPCAWQSYLLRWWHVEQVLLLKYINW